MIAAVAIGVAGACSDDDDDPGGSGGRAGSSVGGSSAVGGDGASTQGGDGDGTSGGTAGGKAGAGGTPTLGGQAGMAGASAGVDAGGGAGEGGAGAGGAPTASLSDAQILLVLDTLNRGEIEEAWAALPRLEDADAEAFAQMMIDDHSAARQSVVATADALDVDPQPSPVQLALEQESEAHVAALRMSGAEDLSPSYMALQVSAHAEALTLLGELESAADAAALQTLIGELSVSVQDHYDTAVEIEADL